MAKLGNISTIGLIVVLIIVMFVVMCVSVFIGQVKIPFEEVMRILAYKIFGYGDISDIKYTHVAIIWRLYTPRAIMGLIIGASLALVGVVMQAMVQNPLADPYILGISSGASLGATFSILMGSTILAGTAFSSFGLEFFAFIGAIGASIAVFFVASTGGRMTSTKLVLSGVIVASLAGALSSLIVYLNPNAIGMRSIAFWSMGSLDTQDFEIVLEVGVVLLICLAFFLTQLRNLNAMMLGDSTATTLGVNLNILRKIYILITALLVALAVSHCGIIGFVGLIIPHIGRGLVGTNHWKLLPICVLIGAIFMMVADIFTRIGYSYLGWNIASDIPIGIITAIIGTPIFAWIMIKKSYGFGGGESRWIST